MGVDPRTTRLRALSLAIAAVGCGWLTGVTPAAAATLNVNTTRDELLIHDGSCSLREAIAAVEAPGRRNDCGVASRRSNAIVLRSRRYTLLLAPAARDDNTSGDLNVTNRGLLTIVGDGPSRTVIDAGRLGDRVLSVADGATLTLRGLRVTGGHPPNADAGSTGTTGAASCTVGGAGGAGYDVGNAGDGGGIFNAGTLVLDTVVVIGNRAAAGGAGGTGGAQSGSDGCSGGNGGRGGSGGGIYNQGVLTVADSAIRGTAAGAGAAGGNGGGGGLGAGGAGGGGGEGGSGGGIYNRSEERRVGKECRSRRSTRQRSSRLR